MKQFLSFDPIVVISDSQYDCKEAKYQSIVLEELSDCKTEKRKTEVMITRSLIYNELKISSISKNDNGRPILSKGDISISHSKELFGVAFSENKNIGLDIETVSEKPRRIKHKFQNEQELFFDESDEDLTRLWTLKEAVYKHLGIPGVLFAEQIWIQKNGTEYLAEYKINNEVIERISLKSVKIENSIISFTF